MGNQTATQKIKHPKALYFCGSIYSFVNFAYYGMKLVLVLFLAEQVSKGGLGLSAAEASAMLASFITSCRGLD